MDVKSWINAPAPEAGPARAGWVQIHGIAMGGVNAAARVEVSLDGGKTWNDARLVGPDLGRYAWRQFVLPVKLAASGYLIACRATDTKGNVQVETTADNAGGYLNSGWRAHAVQIRVV
jgi:sulfite dehydrogenase